MLSVTPTSTLIIPEIAKEGLNGVNRRPSNGLKFNRQLSKMQIDINRQKGSRPFKSCFFLSISADSHGLLALEECQTRKPVPMFSKRSLQTLQDLRTCSYLKLFRNSKGQENLQNTTVNINLYNS